MLKNSPRISKFKLPLLATAVVAVVGCGAYLIYNHYHKASAPTAPAGVNLAPATAEEKQESDRAKAQITQQGQQTTPSSSASSTSKQQVSVIITNASADSVNAYVSGVFEEGGVCTAVFSQGNTTVTRTSTGFGNVSYTQCAPITPNLPSGGSWSVTVSYSSPTAEGHSQTQAF